MNMRDIVIADLRTEIKALKNRIEVLTGESAHLSARMAELTAASYCPNTYNNEHSCRYCHEEKP